MNTIEQEALKKVQTYRGTIAKIEAAHAEALHQAMVDLKANSKVAEMLRAGLNMEQVFEVLQHATA